MSGEALEVGERERERKSNVEKYFVSSPMTIPNFNLKFPISQKLVISTLFSRGLKRSLGEGDEIQYVNVACVLIHKHTKSKL